MSFCDLGLLFRLFISPSCPCHCLPVSLFVILQLFVLAFVLVQVLSVAVRHTAWHNVLSNRTPSKSNTIPVKAMIVCLIPYLHQSTPVSKVSSLPSQALSRFVSVLYALLTWSSLRQHPGQYSNRETPLSGMYRCALRQCVVSVQPNV